MSARRKILNKLVNLFTKGDDIKPLQDAHVRTEHLDGPHEGYVYNIFNSLVNSEASTYFRTGSLTHFPTYSAVETGEYSVDVSLPFTYTQPSNTLNQAT